MKNITQIYNPAFKNKEVEFNSKISINELNTVANGSVENIYCDILDTLEYSKRIEIQNELLKKVMIGGTIQIKIINIILFAKKIFKGEMDINELNFVISDIQSAMDHPTLDSWLKEQQNYSIEKIDIDTIYSHILMKRIK